MDANELEKLINDDENNNDANGNKQDKANLKVIIIGSGVGGCMMAKKLSRYPNLFDFTIISPTSYVELSPSLVAALFSHYDRYVYPTPINLFVPWFCSL